MKLRAVGLSMMLLVGFMHDVKAEDAPKIPDAPKGLEVPKNDAPKAAISNSSPLTLDELLKNDKTTLAILKSFIETNQAHKGWFFGSDIIYIDTKGAIDMDRYKRLGSNDKIGDYLYYASANTFALNETANLNEKTVVSELNIDRTSGAIKNTTLTGIKGATDKYASCDFETNERRNDSTISVRLIRSCNLDIDRLLKNPELHVAFKNAYLDAGKRK